MAIEKSFQLTDTLLQFGKAREEFPNHETFALVRQIDPQANNQVVERVGLTERQLGNLGFDEAFEEGVHDDYTLSVTYRDKPTF